ncbi:uncharacterized oxidoreductase TM_0325-like [Asterias rubens]|uniref:uncharacterized oxidoreductase TM_0325-like n=1 Tax=Asterias rubens TaxID=7604 RepID=UPI0014550003|nr:uncharacterized oxidoreductase TM_0325-like [Asterias rubens]XP_033644906.1 uncharacterized oxidoreductase TM_0325-like [Asterias rubens]
MGSLRRKVALVTGASSGIGAETARQLASLNCQIALTGRSAGNLGKIKDECIEQGLDENLILLLPGDLTDDSFLERILNETVKEFGRLDIVVNCAGRPCLGYLEDSSMEMFDEVFKINLRAPFVLTQLAMPHLVKSKGVVVNVSSCASLVSHPSSLIYCMSKAGLDGLTHSAAQEYAKCGVRVNAVSPGATMTPLFERNGADVDKVIEMSKRRHPLGRHGDVSEVAKAIVFLASDSSSMVTGHCLTVDGGRSTLPGAPLKEADDDDDSSMKCPL